MEHAKSIAECREARNNLVKKFRDSEFGGELEERLDNFVKASDGYLKVLENPGKFNDENIKLLLENFKLRMDNSFKVVKTLLDGEWRASGTRQSSVEKALSELEDFVFKSNQRILLAGRHTSTFLSRDSAKKGRQH